ncbi:3alpha(or 20beta)-hydroxysteroid dehydrogenase [Paenarthrobacter nicotinovorans]|uniref:SDR family oxidoreductase n=1 Tax=Paenarthrobacter nicotinovorans TaxID=29320 RepID=UPI0027887FC3|nr:SDR family oxidoreductase [Paenarthrobacter nicotinovorans]MDP9933807.1 3alpha(or 20beta)-hydroxysteroid dehydrogenase [Paenarthrobacter nicotinovorans]
MKLLGKVALISGGALGMGASHVRAVVAEGGRVVIGDILDDEGFALASELGDAVRYTHLDVRSNADWHESIATAEREFGRLDVVVNNAGILRRGDVESTTDEDWELVMAVNARGVFNGIRASVPALRRAGGGSIINISSTAGLRGYSKTFAYGASKWAVRGMTKNAAADLAPYGIRVNSVHPGHIQTRMANGSNDVSTILLKRAGEPDEISPLVIYLASDESAFSTGAEFIADGGETAAVITDA